MTVPPRRIQAELVDSAPRCMLAESPRWHEGRWWWVDAAAGLVFSGAAGLPEGSVRQWFSTRERVSMVHPAGPGFVLITNHHQLQYLDTRTPHSPGPVLTTMEVPTDWKLNDGAADAAGGMWVGLVPPDRQSRTGRLEHLDRDGHISGSVQAVGLSNGVAYDPSGETMFHADSSERVVWAHRIGAHHQLMHSRVHLRLADEDGMPDGLTTDLGGGLWVAVYGAGEVRRFDGEGVLDLIVEVPTPQVTSVALGGPDGRDLLITTAREGYGEARSTAEPFAGRMFRARSPHEGRPLFQAQPPGHLLRA